MVLITLSRNNCSVAFTDSKWSEQQVFVAAWSVDSVAHNSDVFAMSQRRAARYVLHRYHNTSSVTAWHAGYAAMVNGHPWRNAGTNRDWSCCTKCIIFRRQSTFLIIYNQEWGYLDTHRNWHTTFPAHLWTISNSLSSHEQLLIGTCFHYTRWLHHLWMPSEHDLKDRYRLSLFARFT